MRVLITGGGGYIGTVLTNYLLSLGFKITVVDKFLFGNFLKRHKNLKIIKADIRDLSKISFKNIQSIIHLANISNDPTSLLNPKLSWEVNALSTKFLIEKAIKENVKRFIFASSGSVYGIKKENKVTEDLSLLPITDYNKTKMISERILLSYKDQIELVCIRPATVCGYSPRMRLDVTVNMFVMQALTKRKVTVFGGNQLRPNITLRDMVRIYEFFLKKKKIKQNIFNAGIENLKVIDIAKKIQKKINCKIEITKIFDERSYRLDTQKLLNEGFVYKYSINDAIVELLDNYKKGKLKNKKIYYNLEVMKSMKNI